jgi:hypothetical protein
MTGHISRRRVLARMLAAAGLVLPWSSRTRAQTKTPIEVFKDPSCGCCHQWVEHMNASGFKAQVRDTDTTPIKKRYGIPEKLQSCHTAVVGAFVIEGHVPAADVRTLLARKPQGIVGLTIPGMPASAPGMDLKPFQPYTVLTFDRAGKTTVFARHDRA